MSIEYRRITAVEDLNRAVDLEIEVWGMNGRDAVPANLMRSVSMHGGAVIAAYDDAQMIGMSLIFPLKSGSRFIAWSHMAGVKPAYQGQNVGFGIKQAQRVWALEQGYDEMRWTFDPLQRGNANFNLHRLGATASIYHRNYYGQMMDAINGQMTSDRLEVVWKLRDRRVKALAGGKAAAAAPMPEAVVLSSDADGNPIAAASDAPCLFAQIPRSLKSLMPDEINAWRMALRASLEDAFARGYVAVDFVEQGSSCGYVLEAPEPYYLYVLRCGDDSLYTGMTNDLDARLKQHNTGRGAAFTAARLPVTLLAAWKFRNRSSAMQAEAAFKKLKRTSKLEMIRSGKLYRDSTEFVAQIQ